MAVAKRALVDWLGGANVEDETWRCTWACGLGSHIEIELLTTPYFFLYAFAVLAEPLSLVNS